jgi:uncharacterized membrane protein YhaH (DUF805 family)
MNWYTDVLKNKYATFTGRARRQEYWMFFLINLLIALAIGVVDSVIGWGVLGFLYTLAVLVPSLAIAVRRLHDTGRTGWWILIGLVPFIGWIILVVFLVLDSQPGGNAFGPNPKALAA